MAGTIVADQLEAASTSTLVIKNGVANTPPTIQDSAGTQIGTFCRAWVNFNGTGTVAIRASFNVSSITDNGTGDYTVNFTNALPDANYVANITRGTATTIQYSAALNTLSTNSVRFVDYQPTSATNTNPTAVDESVICVAVFR